MSEIKVLKEVCDACGKNVYPQEKVTADNRIWHKSCFRCLRCNNVLKLGSFAAMEGKFYCKVCFKKLFFSKGNYSEGFGKLTPQQEHDVKTGKVDNIAPPTLPDHLKLAPPAGAKPEEPKKEEPKKEEPKKEPSKKEEPKKDLRSLPTPAKKPESPVTPKKEEPKAQPEVKPAEPPAPEPKAEPPKEVKPAEPPAPEPKEEPPKEEVKSELVDDGAIREPAGEIVDLPKDDETPQQEEPPKEEVKAGAPKPEPTVQSTPKEEPKTAPKTEPAKPATPKEEPKAAPKTEPAKAAPKTEPAKPAPKPTQPASDSPKTESKGGNKCETCGKTVYPMEEFRTNDVIFHKSCFRCKQCKNVLKIGNFASMENEFYCKVCFKKLFFSKGNYSDGFGKLTPQQEHDQKTGKSAPYAYGGSFKGVDKL